MDTDEDESVRSLLIMTVKLLTLYRVWKGQLNSLELRLT